jgi:hypothetical protein
MEGLGVQEKKEIAEKTRDEKLEEAEKNVFAMFNEKLNESLDKIGENPYFKGLEERSF